MHPESMVLGVIALVASLGYALLALTAPVRFRLRHWQSADTTYEPYLGKYQARDVARMAAVLRGMGFAVLGRWELDGHSPATGTVTLLEHPQTLDVARLMDVEVGASRQVTLALQTRFEDGMELFTANQRFTTGLPSPPEITAVWLPEVRQPGELYRVHGQVRDRLGDGKKRLPVGPDPAAFLGAATLRLLTLWVRTGHFYLDEARGVYRPTWKGAVRATWHHLPLVRLLYRAWRRRRTRKLLDELDVEVDPWD
jgi:hypothetical protein